MPVSVCVSSALTMPCVPLMNCSPSFHIAGTLLHVRNTNVGTFFVTSKYNINSSDLRFKGLLFLMDIITFKMHISFQMCHESREATELIDNKADAFTELSISTEHKHISLRNYAADSQVLMAAGCQPRCCAYVSCVRPLLPGYRIGKLW